MHKIKNIKTILILLSAITAFLFFKNQLTSLFKIDLGNQGYYFSRQFDLPERWINTDNLKEIGGEIIESHKEIIYKLPKKSKSRVVLKILYGLPYDNVENKFKHLNFIEICRSNKESIAAYPNIVIGETTIDITNKLQNNEEFFVRLEDLPSTQEKYSNLSIRRIEISVLPQSEKFLPNLSLIATAIVLPFILFYFCKVYTESDIIAFVYSFLSLTLFYGLIYFKYAIAEYFHLVILILISFAYLLIVKKRKIKEPKIYTFFLIVILILAIHLRWTEIERVAFAIPHPDASHPNGLGYRAIADNMKLLDKEYGFYAVGEGGRHEPFYPFVAKIFFSIFGSSDLHLRFVSLFFSVSAVALTYLIAKMIFNNKIIALISSGLIAINKFSIEQASFGLRLELETCLLLLLFYICYFKKDFLKAMFIKSILSGLVGGLWLLTKVYNLPAVLFIFAHSIISTCRKRLITKISFFVLATFFAILIFAPYQINKLTKEDGYFSNTTYYITDFAKREFPERRDFKDQKITFFDYFFKLHTPKQLLNYHMLGVTGLFYFLSEQIFNCIHEQNHLVKIYQLEKLNAFFKNPILSIKIFLFITLFLFSVFVCLLNKELRVIVYVIIFANFANIFLYGLIVTKGVGIIQTQRTIAHVLPFVACCVSYGIYLIFSRINMLVRSR